MRIIFLICLCLVATTGYAGEWIGDQTNGCKVWNSYPEQEETISWSGKCKGGVAEGQGTLKWYLKKSLQFVYEGMIKAGKFSGDGTMTHADGSKYVGEWKDNKPNGNGNVTFQNGNKYVGGFKTGKFSGNGIMTHTDGSKYVGEWRDNKRHGSGSMTNKEGIQYSGGYKNGKEDGNGTMTHPNGKTLVVEFKNGELVKKEVIPIPTQPALSGDQQYKLGESIGKLLAIGTLGPSAAVSGSDKKSKCDAKTFWVTTNGEMQYCSQDSQCNIDCF